MAELIETFCESKSYEDFNKLPTNIRNYFVKFSMRLLKNYNKEYNLDFARKIILMDNKWEYDVIKKGSILYRGGKEPFNDFSSKKSRKKINPRQKQLEFTITSKPTYFTQDKNHAKQYVSDNSDDFLYTFTVEKDINLFKLDSLYNINKLLILTFYNIETPCIYKEDKMCESPDGKHCLYSSDSFYEGIASLFTKLTKRITNKQKLNHSYEKPYQFDKLETRNSVQHYDYKFLCTLCEKFKGYNAFIFRYSIQDIKFPQEPDPTQPFWCETTICNPEQYLTLNDTQRIDSNPEEIKELELIIAQSTSKAETELYKKKLNELLDVQPYDNRKAKMFTTKIVKETKIKNIGNWDDGNSIFFPKNKDYDIAKNKRS